MAWTRTTLSHFRIAFGLLIAFSGAFAVAQEDGSLPPPVPSLNDLPTETPESPTPARDEFHRHDPIDLDARPIIARSKVSFVRPRRILVEPDGQLIVADWGAGTLLRISPDDKTTVLANGLNEPAGLARDTQGNIYVSSHAGGVVHAGTIVKISAMGEQSIVAEGLTGPTALAFDPSGYLCVAHFHNDEVLRISPTGQVNVLVGDIPAPSALVFDASGTLYIASSTEGVVYQLPAMGGMGGLSVFARGLQVPSDLAIDPEGHLIAANFAGNELSYLDGKNAPTLFAVVPKGTIAQAFDLAGNLVLVNWDFQLLMRVTMQLSVPCPHCGKPIPLRFRPRQTDVKPAKPEKKSPVI
ncbi:MAG: NHL repeat-containing protein [Planctomycetaceae bacterium]|nr:NHL repeat-containing protein [Planctomycetaceae bacterium]